MSGAFRLLLALLAVCTPAACQGSGRAEDDVPAAAQTPEQIGLPNVAFPTLGGRQFWSDVVWFAGWRIQENVITGHCRLLDPGDVRRAWGTREQCGAAFGNLRIAEGIELSSPRLVVLLHGLGRSRASLSALSRALEDAGWSVAALAYPSTRRSIAEHADQIEGLLDGLEGVREVSFVTHSLGGLVARAVLARDSAWKQRIAVGRLAMIAPPSHGSALAEELKDFYPYQALLGPAGQEVALSEAAAVPLPACPFGIIAGSRGREEGLSPYVPGDDDGIVGVAETRLEGAEDFLLVRGLHSTLVDDPEVIAAVTRYLDTGRFTDP